MKDLRIKYQDNTEYVEYNSINDFLQQIEKNEPGAPDMDAKISYWELFENKLNSGRDTTVRELVKHLNVILKQEVSMSYKQEKTVVEDMRVDEATNRKTIILTEGDGKVEPPFTISFLSEGKWNVHIEKGVIRVERIEHPYLNL